MHGTYNFSVFLFFLYQASLGFRIRKGRDAIAVNNASVISRHRKIGPLLAALGIGGYIAGVLMVFLDKGHILHYPLHFIVGMLIVLLIMSTVFVSRQIKAGETKFRNIHFRIGAVIILLYILQVSIGVGIIAGVSVNH